MTPCSTVRRLALLGAMTVASPPTGSALAQGITGEFLRTHCDRNSPDWETRDQWVCASYVRGAVDGIRTLAVLGMGSYEAHVKAMPFCMPSGTDMNATIDLVMRHLEADPESRAQVGALAISTALNAKWPCLR